MVTKAIHKNNAIALFVILLLSNVFLLQYLFFYQTFLVIDESVNNIVRHFYVGPHVTEGNTALADNVCILTKPPLRTQAKIIFILLINKTQIYCVGINGECLRRWPTINPLTAKLFNLNFHPLEVVSR